MFERYLIFILMLTTPAFGWPKQHERLVGRIMHVESLRVRGQWAHLSDDYDDDGLVQRLYVEWKPIPLSDIFYDCRTQFLVSYAEEEEKYLKFESVCDMWRNRFLAGGYPYHPNEKRKTVLLEGQNSYPAWRSEMHWTVRCKNDELEQCRVTNRLWTDPEQRWVHDWVTSPGAQNGAYLTLMDTDDIESNYGQFRLYAPNPSDRMIQIFKEENGLNAEQEYKVRSTVGISDTQTSSYEISNTVSLEVGGAFKAFSASAGTSISNSWSTESSVTYSQETTTELKVVIPPYTTATLYQLKGYYAKGFEAGSQTYKTEGEGPDRKKIVRHFHNVDTIDLTDNQASGSEAPPVPEGPEKSEL